MLKLGVNPNVTNEEYHADRQYISSSGLKTVLKDPREYYKKYILGEAEESNNPNFLFGTVAHLRLLEPHLYDGAVTVWKGQRRGAAYDEFKRSTDKIIITDAEAMKLDVLESAFRSHPNSNLLDNCEFEHTMVSELAGVAVKARADAINVSGGFIVDVKTTGYVGELDVFKSTVAGLDYDLSAALYCSIAKQIYNRDFDFYFIVLSKNDLSCRVYKLSSATASIGHTKLTKSLEIYKACILTNIWSHDILSEDDNSILEV